MRIAGIVQDSSDFALSRQQLKLLGGLFAVLGLLEFGASYFIASAITTRQAEATEQRVAQANECKSRLASLGFAVTVANNKISAELSGLDDAAYKLGQASIASLSCQGWALSRFCMGDECGPKGGEQLELEPSKSPN